MFDDKRPRGLADLLHPFLSFFPHTATETLVRVSILQPCEAESKQLEKFIIWLPSDDAQTHKKKSENQNIKWIYNKNVGGGGKCFDVDKNMGRRAREDRWDSVQTDQVMEEPARPPSNTSEEVNPNFSPAYSDTAVLLGPPDQTSPSAWNGVAWHHRPDEGS